MFSLSPAFPGPTFKGIIQKFARQAGWNIAAIEDRAAMFQFHMERSGRVQTLFIFHLGSTLEFVVPLKTVAFVSPNNAPHALSTALLQRNANLIIGFWCVAQIGDQFFFACMHNVEMKRLKAGYFRLIVAALIEECDMVESILTDAEAQADIERLKRMMGE
ncbi:MAG: hypothetical protein NZT92_04510 [Abditibacteriales bacterium]|nr:hypothetical protein [Abditibacteriales bacterium]MDW8365501.1 hypothetical protein [Abditibacteriales bacterium]